MFNAFWASVEMIMHTRTLLNICCANIFSHPVGCLFTFLIVPREIHQVLNFDEAQFKYFFFGYLSFRHHILRNHCLTEGEESLYLCFLFRVMVLFFTFRFLVHFDVIFYVVCEQKFLEMEFEVKRLYSTE